MASNLSSDQQNLLFNENDNLPTYQDAINQNYRTFVNSPTTTNTSLYPYSVDSQPPTVIIIGGCPICKVGILETEFTCLGLCCALFFFPLGLLCCLALRQRRCNFCGAIME